MALFAGGTEHGPGTPDPYDHGADNAPSPNWAGIEDWSSSSSFFHYVHGEFTQPTVDTCSGSDPSTVLIWVGIGGVGYNTPLLQNGTLSDESVTTGPYAWWEAIDPVHNHDTLTVPVPASKMPVSHGDDISLTTKYVNAAKPYVQFHWHNDAADGHTYVYYLDVYGTQDDDPKTGYDEKTVPGHIANYYSGDSAEAIDERAGYTVSGTHYLSRLRPHTTVHWTDMRSSYDDDTHSVPMRSIQRFNLTMTNAYKHKADRVDLEEANVPTDATAAQVNDVHDHCGQYEPRPTGSWPPSS
ncbi:MAG TPA: G1 family glutamic endopeptidase [Mycobacteriales bacterium]|nr:G1 family glutamic endopeptidase [Mycobacteriales bacterium]